MRTLLVLAGFMASLVAMAQSKVERPAPLERSVSSSQQFIIYHSDRALRSRLARRAEDLKEQWLRRLRLGAEWKSPIIIQVVALRRRESPRIRTGLYESDGGELKVQIDVLDSATLRSADFDREVYRALFLEYAYRNVPPKAGKAFHQPPAWLIEGIHEDVVARQEGVATGLYESLIKEESPPKLEAFLKERPEMLDATSRAIYRARCLGLFRALLRAPDGPKHLAEYCASLPLVNPADGAKLLEKFPGLAEQPATLSKLWMLSLADASASDRVMSMSVGETHGRLSVILEIKAPRDPRKPQSGSVTGPEGLQAVARTGSGRYVLRQKAEDLLRLEARAHPLLRPIVEEYRMIASQLAAKPRKNLEARIRKNIQLQQAVVERAGEMEDYMNWFEAARLDTPSREFDSTIDGSRQRARRDDPVSRHLDDIEARGW
ncbi:MAG: hypothetical protein WCD63_07050 [Terrimicrobiaceae bacterium]